MSEFDEKLINRLHQAEREIERLKRWERATNADTVDGLHAAASGANAHVLATDASGNAVVTGNVGIGGTNPPSQLTVFQSLRIRRPSDNNGVTFQVDDNGLLKIGYMTGASDTEYTGTASGALLMEYNGNIWMAGNCSAYSFTDRTPFYDGDALAEIRAIKGKDGKIDHNTLPNFVRVEREVIVEPAVEAKKAVVAVKGKDATETEKAVDAVVAQPAVKAKPAVTEIQQERDLGAMISMMTVGIQQLLGRIEILENKEI